MVVSKDTIIGDILDEDPGTAQFFFEIGMHCLEPIPTDWWTKSTDISVKSKKKRGCCRNDSPEPRSQFFSAERSPGAAADGMFLLRRPFFRREA